MAGNTDPAKALGDAFSHPTELSPHQPESVLNLNGVTAEHTGKEHPIQIHVPPRKIIVEQPTVEQRAARMIAALHPVGTPHGDQFRRDNQHLL